MKELVAFCDKKNVTMLSELTLEHLEKYRQQWAGTPITRRKRQNRLRSFYIYCQRHRWVTENTAALLCPIKVTNPPTLPLTREQYARELECAVLYNPESAAVPYYPQRVVARVQLLRWSGLRVSDGARLERAKLTTGLPWVPSAHLQVQRDPHVQCGTIRVRLCSRYSFNCHGLVEKKGVRGWFRGIMLRLCSSLGDNDACRGPRPSLN